jgi:tetratricopeptide (TPR) repeat protein
MASSPTSVAPLVLREIEGYLELIMILADRFPLDSSTRDPIALRVLATLDELPEENQLDAECLYYRGEALRAMQRHEEAITFLELATRQQSGQVHIWLAIGWCEKRCGRLEQAIAALEQALDIDPDDTLVQYNLACYWSLAGELDNALEYLRLASSSDKHYLNLVDAESDFDAIRAEPQFRQLLSSLADN